MAENLQRVTAKIFADNAPETAVGQFGSALNGTKINTTDVEEIQSLPAYNTGWTSAVVTNRNYPTLEETNGVMKVMSYQTAYTLQKGVPEWDAGTTYFSGDICKAVGSGVLYVSRSDNNLNHPVNDITYWREYQPSATDLPATNYISEMSGSPTYSGNALTLPAMTLYISNGRSGNNTLVNIVENLTSASHTISDVSDGEYHLFYNNNTASVHLAGEYITRTGEEPAIGNNGDVWYSTNNRMYLVTSTNPNYTLSENVTVSSEGVVSNLGTLTFNGVNNIPANTVFNLNFTTGNDVTTTQSLFSAPYADGKIEAGNLTVDIYSTAYGVEYHPIIYSGPYSLQSNETLYSYTLGDYTVYSSTALQLGLTLYSDENLETAYGTVTKLSGESITVETLATVYDGSFSLVTSESYYTYLMGATNYYTSEVLANGVTVYTDTTLETVFGIAADVTDSTVLVQSHTSVYEGAYTTNPEENIYKYTIGETTIYSSGVLIPGLIVYTNPELTSEYGVCESVTTTNVVIHSMDESAGYVATQGTGTVPQNITIYSDVDLTSQVATSTGANATYKKNESSKSKVGTLTYAVTASTTYSGTLSFNNGTSYVLILNELSTSLLSSRVPYTKIAPTVSLGGQSGFLGTFNLSGTSLSNLWTWNGFNTVTPDWVETPLCELGTITIASGDITALDLNYPIELVKMSDLDSLNIQGSGSGLKIGDIGMSVFVDETDNTRRILNGQTIAQSQFKAFTAWLKNLQATYTNLFCTAEEYQSIVSASAFGQCGKFVVDNIEGTIKLPTVINIQGLTDLTTAGVIVEAGLPNITGTVGSEFPIFASGTGCFSTITDTHEKLAQAQSGSGKPKFSVDASRSSSIYGNSDTVQQEQIQYPYFIQIATGVEYEVNIINEIELNNPYTLFDSKYTDSPLYNVSWLLSNGTYYPKSVYVTAYEALLVENNSQITAGTSSQLPSGSTYIKRGLPVKLSTAGDITDYDFVINTTDETFRLPLKSKLASGSAVAGNGLSLGITDGTDKYGARNGTDGENNYIAAVTNAYGVNAGTTLGASAAPAGTVSLGITEDESKSGLETSANGLSLYFYVGETVQNANLINAAEIINIINNKADSNLSNITLNGENRIRDIASVIYDYDNPIVLTGGQWYSFEFDVLVISSAPPKARVYIVTKNSEEKEIVLSSDYTGSIGAPYTSFEFCKNTPFASFAYETPGNNISHTVTAYKRKVV